MISLECQYMNSAKWHPCHGVKLLLSKIRLEGNQDRSSPGIDEWQVDI